MELSNMADTRNEPTKNAAVAVQQFLNINFNEVAPWFGLAVASLWFWACQLSGSGGLFPQEQPIGWLGSTAHKFGLDAQWATTADDWLRSHPIMFWILLTIAVVSAGSLATHPFGHANLTISSLMAAMSVKSVGLTIGLFLLLSFALALTSLVLDTLGEDSHIDVHSTADRWVAGPFLTVVAIAMAPLGFVVAACRRYQAPHQTSTIYGSDLRFDLDDLPDGTLAQMPAKAALRFIGKAIMVALDERERGWGLSSLGRQHPTGAITVDYTRRPYSGPITQAQPTVAKHDK
jgi:hypothetical protein